MISRTRSPPFRQQCHGFDQVFEPLVRRDLTKEQQRPLAAADPELLPRSRLRQPVFGIVSLMPNGMTVTRSAGNPKSATSWRFIASVCTNT